MIHLAQLLKEQASRQHQTRHVTRGTNKGAYAVAIRNLVLALSGVAMLGACGEKEVILQGQREHLRAEENVVSVNQERAIRIPAQKNNAAWTHRIGTPKYRTTNAALSATPQLVWTTSIGKGESRRKRINANPVVADGRIFTVDAEATLAATSTSGAPLWSTSLTPPRDKPTDATGGGLAYADGKIFVSTGYGALKVLDAATGAEIWEQKMEAVGSGTPTVYKDKVYVVSGDDTAWAMDVKTGRVAWRLAATPDITSIHTSAAPAINDRLAIFAFGSGEVQAAFRKGGVRLWNTSLAGQRKGRASATVGDVSGDPVIDGKVLYAANHSGRIVAINMDTGARIWTAEEGSISPVVPVGGSVFMVSDQNKLVRLDAKNGDHIWSVDLPRFVKDRPTRQVKVHAHFGPIMAGGHLIVVSTDGLLRSFDPASGKLLYSAEIPGGAATGAAVAGGTLYVVGTKGQLHAFR